HALDQALGDVELVEHRELHGHERQLLEALARLRSALTVLPVQEDQLAAVEAVDRQDRAREEVDDEDGRLQVSSEGEANARFWSPERAASSIRQGLSSNCNSSYYIVCITAGSFTDLATTPSAGPSSGGAPPCPC